MRAVLPLHSPFGLRRTGRDHLDPQLRAHAPKLRDRLFSPQLLLRRGRTLVQILPVHIQRLRHSVPLDPGAQRIGHRPDRFLLAQLRPGRAGRVIHHVDQAAPRSRAPPATRESCRPSAPALRNVLCAPAAAGACRRFRSRLHNPSLQHPAPQRLGIHLSARLPMPSARPPASAQSAPHRSAVLLPHHRSTWRRNFLVVRAIRAPSRAAVLQPRRALPPDTASTTASPAGNSPAASPARIHHPQLLTCHPRQHFHPAQFLLAHLCPPQSGLLSEAVIRGHFYRGQKGTLSSRHNKHLSFLPLR